MKTLKNNAKTRVKVVELLDLNRDVNFAEEIIDDHNRLFKKFEKHFVDDARMILIELLEEKENGRKDEEDYVDEWDNLHSRDLNGEKGNCDIFNIKSQASGDFWEIEDVKIVAY